MLNKPPNHSDSRNRDTSSRAQHRGPVFKLPSSPRSPRCRTAWRSETKPPRRYEIVLQGVSYEVVPFAVLEVKAAEALRPETAPRAGSELETKLLLRFQDCYSARTDGALWLETGRGHFLTEKSA